MNKAAIYCRVSTEGQEQDGTSLQTQLEACQKYCQIKGYEVGFKFSEAWSGLSLERPRLAELREVVRSESIDCVVVYSLDRFSRDPVHGVILMQELEKHGVSLEAATETVDNSEVGKLVFYIKGYAAKLNAERRRDATGRGKRALLKQGKLPQGTGIGIYGYKWLKEYKKRIPIEHEAKIVQRMFEMVVSGISCFKIAQILNRESIPTKSGKRWEARTVSRIVRNPGYTGTTYFGVTAGRERKATPKESWHVLTNVTPAIISEELFEQAQAALARSKELHPGRPQHEYPLTGFAVCGYCGSPLVGACLSKRYRYYKCCGTYATSSREKICDARYIKADWLESVVWEKVKSVLSNPQVLLAEVSKQTEEEKAQASAGYLEKEIKSLTRKIKGYAGQERRLMSVLRLDIATPDIVLDEINQMKKEREADEKMLSSLIQTKQNIDKMVDMEDNLKELCARIVRDLDNCTNQDKKDAFTYLDLKVKAITDSADIKGYLNPSVLSGDSRLLTTGQTSALPHACSCPRPPGG
ncbi:MAG TPA: recombinase family protein [Dehalococcoidia bacterium]|nr:recombinase family protein [Dehalococcoidia bacterium]